MINLTEKHIARIKDWNIRKKIRSSYFLPKMREESKSCTTVITSWNCVVDKSDNSSTLDQLLEFVTSSTYSEFVTYVFWEGLDYDFRSNLRGSVQHRFSDVTNDDESRPGIRVNMNSRISTCSDQSFYNHTTCLQWKATPIKAVNKLQKWIS